MEALVRADDPDQGFRVLRRTGAGCGPLASVFGEAPSRACVGWWATGSGSDAVCGLRSGAAARKDAELVSLGVGKYDPAFIALADIGVSST